ncbi:MAG: DNA replication complex subunit Gins51 [Promethearchaeota archaeon]
MNLKNDYSKLYTHWINEFKQIELTPLNQDAFNGYKKSLNSINKFEEKKTSKIELQILKSYQENFKFLFNDILKIREIKIINAALALKEINLNEVVEAEKLLYQNLVSSIKGFKKIKDLSIYMEEDVVEENKITETIKLEQEITEKIKITKKSEATTAEISTIEKTEKDFKYMLIRFQKKTPPLVGIDLKNYGPFEKEDIANIPFKNAKILLSEKFAEKIELS